MSVIDFIFTGIITYLNFGLNYIPKEISFFTLADLNTLLTSISNFWVQAFSITSHFFPFGLFFILLSVAMIMEINFLAFRVFKYIINIVRGAGG